jgi:hypothetical protein
MSRDVGDGRDDVPAMIGGTMTAEQPLPVRGLPAPVAWWAEAARLRDVAVVRTIGTSGTGRVRLGALPWLPIDHRTVHRLGREQVRDIRLRIGLVPVVRVLDAFVDGAGITKIGPFASVGPEVDQGAFTAMWVEAIAWPSAWQEAADLRWEPVDDARARLHLPFKGGVETLDVWFDEETAYPNAFEVDRFKARDRRVRWRAECSELRDFGRVRAWSRVSAAWADDPGPWYEATIDRVVLDPPVDRALDRARRAIAMATSRRA